MILLTVLLVPSLHPQSPAAATLYPKADSVNASDIPQKVRSAENEAIIANLAITLVLKFNDNPDIKSKLYKDH